MRGPNVTSRKPVSNGLATPMSATIASRALI